jgi:hypothetical protein
LKDDSSGRQAKQVLNRKRELERTSSEGLVTKKAETQGGGRPGLVDVHGGDGGDGGRGAGDRVRE